MSLFYFRKKRKSRLLPRFFRVSFFCVFFVVAVLFLGDSRYSNQVKLVERPIDVSKYIH